MKRFAYNDYYKLTKTHLKNYSLYEKAIENLEQSMKDMEQNLQSESVKTATYGTDARGGEASLTATEFAAQKRMELEASYAEMQADHRKLEQMYKRLQRALATLTEEEQETIKLFYLQRLGYAGMARQLCYSERTCQRRVKEATQVVAMLLFGTRAMPSVLFIK